MFAGWIIAWYGAYRRDRAGTWIAISGLGLANAAMMRGEARQ